MINLGPSQLFAIGSVSFATLSLALPFPLLNTSPDTTVNASSHVVVQQNTTGFSEEAETAQKTAPDMPEEQKVQKYIIAPLTQSQNAEGLVMALSRPIDPLVNNEEVTPEPKEEKTKPESIPETKRPPVALPRPALSMPVSFTKQVDEKSLEKQEQPLQDVAPSLLLETEQREDGSQASQEKVAEQTQAEEPAAVPEKEPIIGVARRIEVPSIAINIEVRPGGYDPVKQTWTVDDTSAFIADTTVPINDTNGTTLIYGHAKWGLFGALPDLRSGAEAIVHATDGSRFIYTFKSLSQVDPTDLSVFTVEGEPTLVLQTCSGLFDEHRTLASFTLKEVVSPPA